MRIINNVSNVSAEFDGLPANFTSNNVQTIVNDPVVPQCNCNVCFFFDFCSGCYYNPCNCIRIDNSCPFPMPINQCHRKCRECEKSCNRCGRKKTYYKKRCNNNQR